MQARAIFEAAGEVKKAGIDGAARGHDPAGRHREGAARSRQTIVRRVADEVLAESGRRSSTYLVGTMIEVPRGALTADEIARGGRVLQLRHQRPDADRRSA